ncbi:YdeI/OmpD-associated family protein [Domibacillus sp. DTU_2020_1001157_1_SI_ALB_TIR_016]|uniref:YdeI/OmpD-associated family protein n=1 Tax=Domibacillus sp. DTU_2020_1001157_1_SI_ALB_TIR_016 TaxID=3077789 RepID=UPI0028F0B71B|nr:YdeI/OmpD-associated family protein [Domibacillus sp. DTU_2020_1001157_1_SI_ALB_TIR_016]WNS77835.1 YdeI/OmpD-associated family protein [Domibacillus sp. DTU_2020_1001157_1_SI_ALB_TIR_016]
MPKTIVEKLNLKKYEKAAVLNLPDGADYLTELHNYDIDLANSKYDLIFAFVLDMESLKATVSKVIEENHLNKNGYIFLAYPKKGNKVYPTFIHRDELMNGLGAGENGYLGTSNIKFARMVGLDDVFTVVGLKEESRNTKNTSTKASQCVDDYIEMIPHVEKDLQDTPELLAFFQSLTPGYRKDWARYVYSAKQEATKAKRREEMKMILGAGYKSRDLYRRNNS